MTMYQRILASTLFGAVLVDLIQGSLIAFNLVRPPTAQAILLIVMAAFTAVGLVAATLLIISFLQR